MTTSPPSKNPVNGSSFAGMHAEVLRKFSQRFACMLPAVVISYDRATNLAVVQPTITLLTTDGVAVSRPAVASVPVLAYGGGGYLINFPLQPGNKGWIEACDRDISLYMQAQQEESQPNTLRLHSFEDSRFIPDVFAQYELAPTAAGALTIQSTDGAVSVTLSGDTVTIRAPTVDIVAGDVATVTAPAINLVGPVDIDGGLTVDGIVFGTHRHSGITSGGSNSGGPVA